MTARFVACVACGRHVKEGDAVCPFCGKGTSALEPLPRLSKVRMTRAAMIAAGTAGTVAAILDCGQSSRGAAFYGVACTGSECIPGGEDAASLLHDGGSNDDASPFLYDGGSSANFYGVPCTGDACAPHPHGDAGSLDATVADASGVNDATSDE